MSWTGDPIADFNRYDAERQRAEDRLPVCCECGEPIQTDEYYEFDAGKYICPECLDANHKHYTEDYIEGCEF